jgi:hypothetical protein
VKNGSISFGVFWSGRLDDAVDFDDPATMTRYFDVPVSGTWHTDIWVGYWAYPDEADTAGFLVCTFEDGRLKEVIQQ